MAEPTNPPEASDIMFRVLLRDIRGPSTGNNGSDAENEEERNSHGSRSREPPEEPSLTYLEHADRVRQREDAFVASALEFLVLSSVMQQQQPLTEGASIAASLLQTFFRNTRWAPEGRRNTENTASLVDPDSSDQGDVEDENSLLFDYRPATPPPSSSSLNPPRDASPSEDAPAAITLPSAVVSHEEGQATLSDEPELVCGRPTGSWLPQPGSFFKFLRRQVGRKSSTEASVRSSPMDAAPAVRRRRLSDAGPIEHANAYSTYWLRDNPGAFWNNAPRTQISLTDTNAMRSALMHEARIEEVNVTRSAFVVANGIDKQGFEFEDSERRQSLRNRRRANFRLLLDQTRHQMRRRGSMGEGGPNSEFESRRSRVELYHCPLEKHSFYKLAKFHGSCSPNYDHFQLKKLLACTSTQDVIYLQFLNENVLKDSNFIPRDASQKRFPESLFGSIDPQAPNGQTCAFHYNTTTEKFEVALGPWSFPSLNWITSELSARVSLSSPCLYSLGATEHYVAVADSSSSIMLCQRSTAGTLDWILCQRVSMGLNQITNCLHMIEGADFLPNGPMRDMYIQLIQQQAAARGERKLIAAAAILERVITACLVEDVGLKRLALHALRSLLSFRRTRRRMTTGPLLSELARRRAVEDINTVNYEPGLFRFSMDVSFNSFSDMNSNSEAVTFVDSAAAEANADASAPVARVSENSPTIPTSNPVPEGPPSQHNEGTPAPSLPQTAGTPVATPHVAEVSPSTGWSNGPLRPRRRLIRHLRASRFVIAEPPDAPPLDRDVHRLESGYREDIVQQPFCDNQLTIFTASNDKTVREWKVGYRLVPLSRLRSEEIRDRICLLEEAGFSSFVPTDDNNTVAAPVLSMISRWDIPFRANHVTLHPHKDLLLVVGDHPSALIYSRSTTLGRNSGRPFISRLGASIDPLARGSSEPLFSTKGHHDCGFAAAWSPDGFTFATGNDDETINVWDLRHLRAPLAVRKTSISACRSLTYSPNGEFLVSAESEDVAVIYDVKSNYSKVQKVPFFGGCTGATFTHDGQSLFIGVAAPHKHGGLIELFRDCDQQ